MIRGFVTGALLGGVVAVAGLGVVSQLSPRSAGPVGKVQEDVAASPAPVQPQAAVPAPDDTGKPASVPGVGAPQAPVLPSADAALPPVPTVEPAPAILSEAEKPAAASPDPVALAEPALPPTEPVVVPPDAPDLPAVSAAPVIPALTTPVTPEAALSQSAAPLPEVGPSVVDQPLPAPEKEALLQLPPTPLADPAPASIAPEPAPQENAAVPTPLAPAADAAPVSPLPQPVPAPDATPDAIAVEPAPPIIAQESPDPQVPEPLPNADGVTTGRLPRIGVVPEEAAPVPVDEALPADAPPLARFARAFENPDAKPLFAILLRDTGAADLDRETLARIAFPVTFVVDPLAPGATEAMAIYRAAGQEVLMRGSGVPQGATAGDLEQSFQVLATSLPEAVGMIDEVEGGFQNNRPLAAQIVPILQAQGRGLVTFDTGLNAADQEARRAGLPSATIFRRLDAEGEAVPTIRRYLDRAAFKAAQEGRVVVMGDARPETVAAILEWAVEGRSASVALAPVTAVLQP